MNNRAMERKLQKREAIDVSKCERTSTGDYVLPLFTDDVDYCDAVTESWVWSIGELLRPLPSVMADGSRRTLPAGTFLAALDGRHYTAEQSETIKCRWLR